jgi:hypothetical protein
MLIICNKLYFLLNLQNYHKNYFYNNSYNIHRKDYQLGT